MFYIMCLRFYLWRKTKLKAEKSEETKRQGKAEKLKARNQKKQMEKQKPKKKPSFQSGTFFKTNNVHQEPRFCRNLSRTAVFWLGQS